MEQSTRTRSRLFVSAPVLLLLAAGCTDAKENKASGDAKADGKAASADPKASPTADGKAGAVTPPPKAGDPEGDKPGLAGTIAKAIPGKSESGLPDRGSALAWVIMRNTEETLGKVKKNVLPSKYAMYGDIATLRSMAGMLGEKSKIVQHFNFAEPAGCVLLEDKSSKLPFACFFGYEGGATVASAEIAEGLQADGKGHIAHHVVQGQDFYVDEIGSTVIVTSSESLFGSSKGYLTDSLLPHAKAQPDDLAMVAFPSALLEQYGDDVNSLMAMAGGAAAASIDTYKEVQSLSYSFALEPDGAHIRTSLDAAPGSDYAGVMAAMSAGPLEPKWVSTLPASTWATTAYRFHSSKIRDISAMKPTMATMIEGYAGQTGKNPADVTAAVEAFLDESEALYGASFSFSVMHEPGTTGAIVVELEKAASGREQWKTWSSSFTPEAVLGKDAAGQVSWSFKPDGVTVDGVSGDRWTIEPGPKAKGDPDVAEVMKRFGGKAELTIDRFELDDRVVFVAAMSDIDASNKAALAAAKGTKTITDAPGGKAVVAAASKTAGVMAGDGKRMFAWLSAVAPEGAPYPKVGVDLTDLLVTTDLSATHMVVDMRMSQALIDQVKTLVP